MWTEESKAILTQMANGEWGVYEPIDINLFGSVSIEKHDAVTGQTAQGEATLAGAVYEVINSSTNSVVVNGKIYAPGEVICKLTTDAKGIAKTENIFPVGRYTIRESAASKGYLVNSNWQKTFSVTAEKKDHSFTYADGTGCPETVIAGKVQITKKIVNTIDNLSAAEAGAKFSVTDSDPVTPDQPGPAPPPESPVEEEIVTPSGSQQRKTRLGKSPTRDGAKGKLNPAKDGADAIQKEQQIKGPARRRNSSIKTFQKTERTIKQTSRTAEQSAKALERSVKGTQKAVKTAEQSSKVAIKTAQETAKAAQKSAQAAAKAAEKAGQIARATAKAAAAAAKAAAKACVAAVKAIIAAVKELVAAIAAGSWVAVVIIIVIMLVALIVGSCSYV